MSDYKTARNYKDRLFRFIFGDEKRKKFLMSLYNALNGTAYEDEELFVLTTIEDVIYMKMKNDLSFIVSSEMSVYEHQSTYNPNMPLREFEYCAKLYDKYITENSIDVYARELQKIPAPKCVVFYNGEKECNDVELLRLSDAFEVPSEGYEWTVTVINVNHGHNGELLGKCQALQEYSQLVQKIRCYAKTMAFQDAVDRAIVEMVEQNGVLSEMLQSHRAEVIDMCITEYNEKLHEETLLAEGRAEGRVEGRAEGRVEGRAEGRAEGQLVKALQVYKNCLARGMSKEDAMSIAELTEEDILRLNSQESAL